MPNQTIVYQGKFTPEQEKTYVHLPFDVPPETTRLHVEYTYNHRISAEPGLSGGNTLDLGVFGARGIDFLTADFRGWSGSERSSFFITETSATPGYLAGKLDAGHWHVLLGLYKIAPEGCEYRVTITLETTENIHRQSTDTDPASSAHNGDLPASLPRAPFAPWLRGELHCHTWHSDGDRSAADVVQLARERGLDFLAISDHNTIASQRELAHLNHPGLILIRGLEATTFKGHFNIWGIPDWVDFRVQTPAEMYAAIQFANARGAVTSCNHPKPGGPAWDYTSVTNYHCVEVWNGPWTLLNQMALDFWVKLLESGKRIPAIGGSDWHRQRELEDRPPRAPGIPTVWVYVTETPSASAILNAIRAGHVVLSAEPEGAFVDLRAGTAICGDLLRRPSNGKLAFQVYCRNSAGNILRLLDQQSILFERAIARAEETLTIELPIGNCRYVRAELRTPEDDLQALTNPLYFEE